MKTETFNVVIPNSGRNGVAYTVSISVQIRTDPATGIDVLTPESLELIERTQAECMKKDAAEYRAAQLAKLNT
jgi:hypothetical protein